jgi:two-component system nitrate/nitrite response regulator NarL
MSIPLRVVVVDDHPLFRAGVVQAIQWDASVCVVAQGSTSSEAIELVQQHGPDVLLLDISIPGNGISAAEAIAATRGAPRILMLTVSADSQDVLRAIDAGAVGYVLKGINANDLIAAVKGVASGETFISPNLSLGLISSIGRSAKPDPRDALTTQESRILKMLGQGKSNREIGELFGVREKTVKYHVTNVLRKLGVRNRVEAALISNGTPVSADDAQ